MITITRNLARQLRTVFRKSLRLSNKSPAPPVSFQAGLDGLLVRVKSSDAMVEYRLAARQEPAELLVPFDVLHDCEGRGQEAVTLRAECQGRRTRIVATWQDRGIPQLVQYDPPQAVKNDPLPAFPPQDRDQAENPPSLLAALHDAAATADTDVVRYSLDCLQLDGGAGRIAAADGRQLLVQHGYAFPWDDAVLVPATQVFGCRELPQDAAVRLGTCTVGKKDVWIAFRIGPWTIFLRARHEARFPPVADHIREARDVQTTAQVSEADAAFLLEALKRLPTGDEFNLPVTLDLNGQVAIRAQGDDAQAPTEVVLSQSTVDGQAMRLSTNRKYLGQALKLGFRQIQCFAPELPIQCQDDRRTYVWAVLGAGDATGPSSKAVRLESPPATAQKPCPVGAKRKPEPEQKPTKKKRSPTNMAKSQSHSPANGSSNTTPAQGGTNADTLIQQAEDLKESLRGTLAKTTHLITSLKQHNKAAKAVDSALSSLRQLQTHSA